LHLNLNKTKINAAGTIRSNMTSMPKDMAGKKSWRSEKILQWKIKSSSSPYPAVLNNHILHNLLT
jgi:hypothetical protein